MKFSVKKTLHADDIPALEHAMKTVDAEARVAVDLGTNTVSVDSWLMPEEFFIAFADEDFDVNIAEA